MKKYELKISACLFLVSFFAEVHFMTATTKDVISILGVGIVILISGYLVLDSLEEKKEEFIQMIKENLKQVQEGEKEEKEVSFQTNEITLEEIEKLEKMNKIIYAAIKKETVMVEEEFLQLKNNLTLLEEIRNASTDELLGYDKKIFEANKKIYQVQKNLEQRLLKLEQLQQLEEKKE